MCIPNYVSVRCYDMSNLVFVSKLIYLFHDNAPLLFKGWYQNMYPFEGMSDDVYCRQYLCFKTLLKIAPQFPDCCRFHKGKERKKIINKEENKTIHITVRLSVHLSRVTWCAYISFGTRLQPDDQPRYLLFQACRNMVERPHLTEDPKIIHFVFAIRCLVGRMYKPVPGTLYLYCTAAGCSNVLL